MTTLINLITVLINVGIVALCLKLYTAYFKDKSDNNRKDKDEYRGGGFS